MNDVREHVNHKETEISTKKQRQKGNGEKVICENYMLTYK